MGDVLRAYRAHRGELPAAETWDTIDLGPPGEAVFIVGRVAGSRRRLYWRPQVGSAPHGFIAGRTRLGKTSLLKAWALVPILQNRFHGTDWLPPVVLDPKATGSFKVAEENGAEVVKTMGAIKDRLDDLWQQAETRNRRLGKLVLGRPDKRGVARPFSPEKVYDLTAAEREEHGMRPVYVTFEEMRDLLGEGDHGLGTEQKRNRAKVNDLFTQLVQKAGSAGIHIMGGVQQPRADVIGSYARDQMAARILVGRADTHTVRMVMGEEEAKRVLAEAEVLDPGHGYAVGISRDRIVERVYVPLFDVTAYGAFAPPATALADPVSLRQVDEVVRGRAAPRTSPTGEPPRGGLSGGLRGAMAWSVGPVVRVGLRAGALRWVVGEVLEGPFLRRQEVVRETWRESRTGRCAACGRGGQLEVDHRRPLFMGGRDVVENTRLLCRRAGRASCHGAKSGAELVVLNMRRRVGRAPGPKPPPLLEGLVNLVRLRRPWWWGLWAAFLFGLLWAPVLLQAAALGVLVLAGPVWGVVLAKASRRDVRASPDGAVDPTSRRSPAIEALKAKGGRGWRERFIQRHHRRMTAAALGRHYALRVTGLYLLGAWAVWLLVTIPGIAWTVTSLLV